MEKFKYAPGLPGYGTQGADGSAGSNGLCMYFTDLNGTTDQITITNDINSNNVLLSSSPGPLPGGRIYQTGDMFVDTEGIVYKIDLTLLTKFISTGAYLNTSNIFVSNVTNAAGFLRYSNKFNDINDTIVDSVYSNNPGIVYTTYPNTIYGIGPINFERIEYSDVIPSNPYNPFTLFTSGVADNQSLALVRDNNANQFRLGNLDPSGLIRDVDLIFDVSGLIVNRTTGSYFTSSAPTGSLLSNNELKINNLVDPVFVSNPSSFNWVIGAAVTDISLYWNLQDIAGTTSNIVADLYVIKDIPIVSTTLYNFNGIAVDSSVIIFRGINSSGVLGITGLNSGNTYTSYIKIYQNGWERDTNRLKIYPGLSPYLNASLGSGLSQPLNATSLICSSSGGVYILDLSANVAVTVSTDSGTWVHPSRTSFGVADVSRGSWGALPHDSSIKIDTFLTTGSTRYATLSIIGSTINRTVNITQNGPPNPTQPVKLTASWSGATGGSNGYIGYVTLEVYVGGVWTDTTGGSWTSPSIHPVYSSSHITTPETEGTINAQYYTYRFNAQHISVIDGASTTRYQTWGGGVSGSGQYSSTFTISAGSSLPSATVAFHG